MAASRIVTCPNCGKRNRIGSSPRGVPRCAVCHAFLSWIIEVDAAGFDPELESSVPVLVDLWAPWCGPCRMVTPIVERMAHDYAGRLKVVKLNVDEAPDISARYGIQGIPLLVLFRDGAELDRLVGAHPEPRLRQWLEPHLSPAESVQPS